MHANITHTTVDMNRWDEAREGIAAVKEMLQSRNGFMSAIWFAPIEAQGSW